MASEASHVTSAATTGEEVRIRFIYRLQFGFQVDCQIGPDIHRHEDAGFPPRSLSEREPAARYEKFFGDP
jgi:hypothetical protein